ncbi:MAG: glycosyltransferase [Flavobacteriales bacterium]|nr:glycosyltransferase [Flavobacteriales bacterium]
MKLLFVIPSITNYYTFLEDIAEELVNKGNQVFLATSTKHISNIDCYDRDIHGELIEIEFPRGFEWTEHLKASKKLDEIIQKVKPDVVNVHFSAAIFTTAIAKTKDWPVTIGTFHGVSFPMEKGWRKIALGLAESWAAKKFDKIFVLTEDDRKALIQKSKKINADVIWSYGLGCDLSQFDPNNISEEKREKIRKRFGLRKDHFVYIFVGRQVHFKGFDKLIRAFVELFSRNIKLRLILVGDKDNIHSTHLDPTEEKILNNCPGIIKVGWQENVQDYLSVAHVNVFPSIKEGMPVNLMESLAMGVPVITVDSRGCRNVVEDNKDGIILKDQNVERLKEKMRFLCENRAELARMVDNALKERAKFDRKYFIKDQLELYDKLIVK